MPYKTEELYKKAIEIAKDPDCHFIEDVIVGLPCVKSVFYDHFPIGSNESNNIKAILDKNRISVKKKLRKNWSKSDNPTMELALYKLVGSEEERRKLSQSFQDHKHEGEIGIKGINYVKPEEK